MNIIITGSSSGVGFEAAIELLQDSSNSVIAIARSLNKLRNLESIAKALNPDCRLSVLAFDIIDGNYLEQLIPLVAGRFEQVDVLINNAGVLVNKPFEDSSATDFIDMFKSNVIGHANMTRAVLPFMQAGAHIVNIGSMGGYQGSVKFPGLSAYSASKSALHTLTECLAVELSQRQIKVNCLALGSAQTEMLEAAFPEYQSPVQAFEMGKFIADFAATGHKFFNGKILPVALSTP